MLFNFFDKRRVRRVLEAASSGILSSKEIASRSKLPEWRAIEILRTLERDELLVSGTLMPVGLKVYRLTKQGEAALAKSDSI
jgi:hypothetical protein